MRKTKLTQGSSVHVCVVSGLKRLSFGVIKEEETILKQEGFEGYL